MARRAWVKQKGAVSGRRQVTEAGEWMALPISVAFAPGGRRNRKIFAVTQKKFDSYGAAS
jgi:hypothetical protein